eukprot:TRINITY_DN25453_c0_g1_i1.p1 TRINITY_DN25453_c0_g1~~TRINITY_DN25453_c0_g1_i1.p1  ORF type:complete len:562 (+),score=50.12 TRINITY_DN25453_c0_g1_i1:50-1735(+)
MGCVCVSGEARRSLYSARRPTYLTDPRDAHRCPRNILLLRRSGRPHLAELFTSIYQRIVDLPAVHCEERVISTDGSDEEQILVHLFTNPQFIVIFVLFLPNEVTELVPLYRRHEHDTNKRRSYVIVYAGSSYSDAQVEESLQCGVDAVYTSRALRRVASDILLGYGLLPCPTDPWRPMLQDGCDRTVGRTTSFMVGVRDMPRTGVWRPFGDCVELCTQVTAVHHSCDYPLTIVLPVLAEYLSERSLAAALAVCSDWHSALADLSVWRRFLPGWDPAIQTDAPLLAVHVAQRWCSKQPVRLCPAPSFFAHNNVVRTSDSCTAEQFLVAAAVCLLAQPGDATSMYRIEQPLFADLSVYRAFGEGTIVVCDGRPFLLLPGAPALEGRCPLRPDLNWEDLTDDYPPLSDLVLGSPPGWDTRPLAPAVYTRLLQYLEAGLLFGPVLEAAFTVLFLLHDQNAFRNYSQVSIAHSVPVEIEKQAARATPIGTLPVPVPPIVAQQQQQLALVAPPAFRFTESGAFEATAFVTASASRGDVDELYLVRCSLTLDAATYSFQTQELARCRQ